MASLQGIDDNTWYVKHKQHVLIIEFTSKMIGTTFIDLILFVYLLEVRVVGLSSFRNLWRKLLPHLSNTKPTCAGSARGTTIRSSDLTEAVK